MCCLVLPPEIIMHDTYIGGRFQRMKSLVNPVSDVPENLQLYSCLVVLPPEIVMHAAYIGRRSENNIKCIVVHNDLGQKNLTT